MTDASDFAVGSVLQQHIETTVEPLGFFSRKLSATEKKYSTFDRELLSIYLSVKHFRHMLEGREHPGVKATQKLISARFVWKNLNKDCALWCKNCTRCQRSKVSRHTKSPVGTFPLPSARFSNVHIDVVGPLSPVRGMSYLLTCVDRFTRWPEVFPIPDQTAIARTFLLGWIARFGIPERITSDCGTNFQSNLFSSLQSF
ncbi:transposon Ty3-I Gag-Pol polyprotein [Trichonephila clavipes]|nr:transposon Ty3-I Gag-Pol polyprotein [Trichonephila clavipes]